MQGYFWNGEWMIPLYLLVLGVLQLLCVIWLFDIAKGVYAFVVSRGRAGNINGMALACGRIGPDRCSRAGQIRGGV